MDSPDTASQPETSASDRDGKTLIVGLGSPILRDDAVGLHVVRALGDRLPDDRFSVIEAGVAGLRLLLLLDGWDRAVIVDALVGPPDPSDQPCPGRLHRLPLDALQSTLTLNTSHEASLADTLELGRLSGMHVPREITIFGIEVIDAFTFDEAMSPEVAERVEDIADEIANLCLAGERVER